MRAGKASRGRLAAWFFRALACVTCASAQAQTIAPLTTPNLNIVTKGEVLAVAMQPDGAVILGGSFTSINGFGRGNIARLRPDGTLDPSWNPSANDTVTALAVDPANNDVYVGGRFSQIGGRSRLRLAKILASSTGAVDATWNPSPNNWEIRRVALGAGGLLVSGDFTSIGTQTRQGLARLALTGAGNADASWNPAPSGGAIDRLVFGSTGAVYVSGAFTAIGGQPRAGLAKLSGAAGSADPAWHPVLDGVVRGMVADTAGGVYVGGEFTTVDGVARKGLARLTADGASPLEAMWNPCTTQCYASPTANAADGYVYVSGDLGGPPYGLRRLSASGSGNADPAWHPWESAVLTYGAVLLAPAANKIYVGGVFTHIGGAERLSFAQIDASGATTGTAIDAERTGQVDAIAPLPGGGAVVGGVFSKANGIWRRNLLRLNADGTLDTTWNPSVDDWVHLIARSPVDGSIYIGGYFHAVGGVARDGLAKIGNDANGTVDPTWNPTISRKGFGSLLSMVVDGTGALYLAGDFVAVGGYTRYNLAKFNSSGDGSVDPLWNPATDMNGLVFALAPDGAGSLYVGGGFTTMGGQNRSRIAKVSTSGTGLADPQWNPSADDTVDTLALGPSGALYAGGYFHAIGGQARCHLAKLSTGAPGLAEAGWQADETYCAYNDPPALAVAPDGALFASGQYVGAGGEAIGDIGKFSSATGALDTSWDPYNYGVSTLAISSAGTLYAGGYFTQIGGRIRTCLAALPLAAETIFRNGFEVTP